MRILLKTSLLWGFLLLSACTLVFALSFHRAYQDSWILEDLWIPLALLGGLYIIQVVQTSDNRLVTVSTSLLVFLLFALPALKYVWPIGSAVDDAWHTLTARSIALTGQVDPHSPYRETPGFHAMLASLAQLSGLPVEFWLKIVPSLLGSSVPMAYYMLTRRLDLPVSASKAVIILSGLSLPLLYSVRGTNFTIPLFTALVIFLFLHDFDPQNSRIILGYSGMRWLLIAALLLWHPSTCLIASVIFLSSGLIGLLDRKGRFFLKEGKSRLIAGVLILGASLAYWSLAADFVWSKALLNIDLLFHREIVQTKTLIPARFFEITLPDKLIIGTLLHSRDAIFVALAMSGLVWLIVKRQQVANARLLWTWNLTWVMAVMCMAGIMAVDFAAQGYKRFLVYVITLSPVLAGYGVWNCWQFLRKRWGFPGMKAALGIGLALVILLCALQLYPYQPAIPTYSEAASNVIQSPLLWLHQVNTDYQYRMLNFARQNLTSEGRPSVDYFGWRQTGLFFGSNAMSQVSWIKNRKPRSAFMLLHWPGVAGAYHEQAEYRTLESIQDIRNRSNVSTVYDNGGSFILYYPNSLKDIFPSKWK